VLGRCQDITSHGIDAEQEIQPLVKLIALADEVIE
jgi:hypothetical protein